MRLDANLSHLSLSSAGSLTSCKGRLSPQTDSRTAELKTGSVLMAERNGPGVLVETWAAAAKNTSGHRRDHMIEVMKRGASSSRSAEELSSLSRSRDSASHHEARGRRAKAVSE